MSNCCILHALQDEDAGQLMKLCLKIFWSSTYLHLPTVLQTEEQFQGWMTSVHTLILCPIPEVSSGQLHPKLKCFARGSQEKAAPFPKHS